MKKGDWVEIRDVGQVTSDYYEGVPHLWYVSAKDRVTRKAPIACCTGVNCPFQPGDTVEFDSPGTRLTGKVQAVYGAFKEVGISVHNTTVWVPVSQCTLIKKAGKE